MPEANLKGRVVLCAGSSSGMGRATARMLADAGANLILTARNAEALKSLATELEGAPGEVLVAPADATSAEAIDGVVARAHETFGRIDVLVNTVGTNIARRSVMELTPQSWSDMLAVNLTAGFNLTRSVVPVMRRNHDGLIIHVSSTAAKTPDRSGIAYQASKAGIAALAHGCMEEERDNGLRVTVLYPGLTDTPLVLKRPTPTPPEVLQRALQPQDVAAACMFVMSLPPRVHIPELVMKPSR
jgi:NADP-dependent 3-hydroxy acid dehydrogenase YdfG